MTEQELLDKGYRKYSGKDIDVFFNTNICEHSGHCVRSNGDVFDVNRRPWIIADNADSAEVAEIIDGCPSGALKYVLHK
ncbi:(4Fe-4S)-binding protein [Vagococcus acidifermentans]|uniref:Divergent 4Fe-4S mono-cluster domain-containing protein n=1 Tax=Vagococcus acidifermentans TaxID=564710 RepID=A0A430B2U0_9ENTE|nr:(4Fe-4S)-binding protein [Vagococcus acidifermentans]RSU14619.1 hypothetical protein CBF27_01145 [Vagococcus acidifermentans]